MCDYSHTACMGLFHVALDIRQAGGKKPSISLQFTSFWKGFHFTSFLEISNLVVI